jgi:predicted nucleic acid-binding protein
VNGIDHLIDTNVVIGLLKGTEAAVALAQQAGLALDRAAVSQITRMELLGFAGLTDAEEQATRNLLSAVQVVGITAEVEALAIGLRRSGALKLPDAIVAASALSTGAALLTLDQRLARVVDAKRGSDAR